MTTRINKTNRCEDPNCDCDRCEEDKCTHCGRDTSFSAGNGLYVNRIPSDDDYMCVECQVIPCDRCGDPTLDYEFLDGPYGTELVCPDCYNNELA